MQKTLVLCGLVMILLAPPSRRLLLAEPATPLAFDVKLNVMGQVTPGKMFALCECQGLPNPEIMAKDGPHWLYCLPWYVGKDPKWNPPDWVKKVYGHELFVTLDRLPKWSRRDQESVAPQP